MYNSTLHYVASMRRDLNGHKSIQELAEFRVNEVFKPFKYDAEEIYAWAIKEFGFNAELAKATMLYLKSSNPEMFDAVMAVYNAKQAEKAAATETESPAPAATIPAANAAPVLKSTDSVKPRVFPVAPATTYEQAQKYGATPYTCGCPDRAARNGSYTGLDGRPACKHMLHMQRYYTDIAI